MSKILLIDGHSIIHRAFYGVPDLTNSSGLHTNGIFGFLNIMLKAMEDEKPTHLAVAFDLHAPTFRHEMYKEYKGTRHPMPDELREQIPVLKKLLSAMDILIMEKEGLEADDILGTMAKNAQKSGMDAVILSGDRDLLQIADERIKIRIPKTKGGRTEVEEYFPEDVVKTYGVTPECFIDVKALMGDSSDNIPGVPKVGEKTAIELIQTYGSIDGIYDKIDSITKAAIKKSLEENKELAYFCKKLVTIVTDAKLPFTIEDAVLRNLFNDNAYSLVKELELKSFLSRFEHVEKKSVLSPEVKIVKSKDAYPLIEKILNKEQIGLYVHFGECNVYDHENSIEEGQMSLFAMETPSAPKIRKMLAIALSDGEETVSLHVDSEEAEEKITKLLWNAASVGRQFVVGGVKPYYHFLPEGWKQKSASEISKAFYDVCIGAYLLNPLKNDYDSEAVITQYYDPDFPSSVNLFGKMKPDELLAAKEEEYLRFIGLLAAQLLPAKAEVENKIKTSGMEKLFHEIEMPLSYCLFEMEQEGIGILPRELKAYTEDLSKKIDALKASITEAAGEEFNINSPKQLAEILFEKLGLPGGKKTKTGYSTAADVLEKLAEEHTIVADILEYRTLSKLKSTYGEGLAGEIAKDGRIHTTFQQTVTATGRLSSTEPNLQNIPIRMEMGRLIRKAFVPRDGYVFLDADYSQIELRILAHLSEDAQLIEAYNSGEDIHAITASKVFHVPLEQVDSLLRRRAKAVNFGIVYGISSFGLGKDLNLSKKEAQKYIDEYFLTYPGIKNFLDKAVSDAKESGYSRTLYGRIRPIPELKSSNFMQRSFGERVAMNAPIQGTAADIMKLAMIRVRDALCKECPESKVLIQVHDELLLEVKESELAKARKILQYEMEHAADLAVKLETDIHTGRNWYEAK